MPEIPLEVDEDEETIKIVQLVKSNEPLVSLIICLNIYNYITVFEIINVIFFSLMHHYNGYLFVILLKYSVIVAACTDHAWKWGNFLMKCLLIVY